MKKKIDPYARLERRIAMITRIAEMGRDAARLPWASDAGRRARARVDAMLAELKRTPR